MCASITHRIGHQNLYKPLESCLCVRARSPVAWHKRRERVINAAICWVSAALPLSASGSLSVSRCLSHSPIDTLIERIVGCALG